MRIRTIKPEFFTHEALHEAEAQAQLPLRLAFVGLWCVADREGRFKWEPRRLGVQILPYDAIDFSRVLDALLTRGFLVKYACGSDVFGFIPSFTKHQVINNKEKASALPEPILDKDSNAWTTRESRDNDASLQGSRGREGKGKERNMEGDREKELAPAGPIDSLVSLETVLANCGQYGASEEIARSWWNKRESEGWQGRNGPVVKWQPNLSAYAQAWRSNEAERNLRNRQQGKPVHEPGIRVRRGLT